MCTAGQRSVASSWALGAANVDGVEADGMDVELDQEGRYDDVHLAVRVWGDATTDHNPYRACRVGEASNPGLRGGVVMSRDSVCSPVPTDICAPTTMADTPTSAASPVATLLEIYDELDRSYGRACCAAPRVHKRWQAKGSEVCTACGTLPPSGRWAYMCSACPVFYCNAQCRNREFDVRICADARVDELAPTTIPEVGGQAREVGRGVGTLVTAATNVELDAVLEKATARPALRTMESIPRQHRGRAADVLKGPLDPCARRRAEGCRAWVQRGCFRRAPSG